MLLVVVLADEVAVHDLSFDFSFHLLLGARMAPFSRGVGFCSRTADFSPAKCVCFIRHRLPFSSISGMQPWPDFSSSKSFTISASPTLLFCPEM
jgi:hypothetical protein